MARSRGLRRAAGPFSLPVVSTQSRLPSGSSSPRGVLVSVAAGLVDVN